MYVCKQTFCKRYRQIIRVSNYNISLVANVKLLKVSLLSKRPVVQTPIAPSFKVHVSTRPEIKRPVVLSPSLVRRCSSKYVFLKISQISQENACVWPWSSLLIKLQAWRHNFLETFIVSTLFFSSRKSLFHVISTMILLIPTFKIKLS